MVRRGSALVHDGVDAQRRDDAGTCRERVVGPTCPAGRSTGSWRGRRPRVRRTPPPRCRQPRSVSTRRRPPCCTPPERAQSFAPILRGNRVHGDRESGELQQSRHPGDSPRRPRVTPATRRPGKASSFVRRSSRGSAGDVSEVAGGRIDPLAVVLRLVDPAPICQVANQPVAREARAWVWLRSQERRWPGRRSCRSRLGYGMFGHSAGCG